MDERFDRSKYREYMEGEVKTQRILALICATLAAVTAVCLIVNKENIVGSFEMSKNIAYTAIFMVLSLFFLYRSGRINDMLAEAEGEAAPEPAAEPPAPAPTAPEPTSSTVKPEAPAAAADTPAPDPAAAAADAVIEPAASPPPSADDNKDTAIVDRDEDKPAE